MKISKALRFRIKSIRKKDSPHRCEQCDVVLPRGFRLCMFHYSQTVKFFHLEEWKNSKGAA